LAFPKKKGKGPSMEPRIKGGWKKDVVSVGLAQKRMAAEKKTIGK